MKGVRRRVCLLMGIETPEDREYETKIGELREYETKIGELREFLDFQWKHRKHVLVRSLGDPPYPPMKRRDDSS